MIKQSKITWSNSLDNITNRLNLQVLERIMITDKFCRFLTISHADQICRFLRGEWSLQRAPVFFSSTITSRFAELSTASYYDLYWNVLHFYRPVKYKIAKHFCSKDHPAISAQLTIIIRIPFYNTLLKPSQFLSFKSELIGLMIRLSPADFCFDPSSSSSPSSSF